MREINESAYELKYLEYLAGWRKCPEWKEFSLSASAAANTRARAKRSYTRLTGKVAS